MEATNDALKLVAQSVEILKVFVADHNLEQIGNVENAIFLLNQAIDKLST